MTKWALFKKSSKFEKKLNNSQKILYYFYVIEFTSKLLFYRRIPGDFMNKQFFKQQVVLSMWAGYKIVAQKKNYFKWFKPGINKVGLFKLSYFSHVEEEIQYQQSGPFLIFDVLQDISWKNSRIKNISRPADKPKFLVYKTIKTSFFVFFSPFFIKMAVSWKLRSTR